MDTVRSQLNVHSGMNSILFVFIFNLFSGSRNQSEQEPDREDIYLKKKQNQKILTQTQQISDV